MKKTLKLALQLTLTVLVTWVILDAMGLNVAKLGQMDPARLHPHAPLLAAATFTLLLGYLFSAALWGVLARDLGGPRLRLSEAMGVFMAANLGRYLPGKVWQIAGLAIMARQRGVPAAIATAAAVLGQGIALGAATLLGLGVLITGPQEWLGWGRIVAAGLAIVGAVGFVPPVFRKVVHAFFRLARQDPPSSLAPGSALRWTAWYVLNWCVYAVSFWLLVEGLGWTASPISVGSAFAAAYVLGYLAVFAPAGVGVREGFLVVFLTPSLGAGDAALVAVVARVWTTVVEVIPAGLFWGREVVRSHLAARADGSGSSQ